jgi:hypothetical protein
MQEETKSASGGKNNYLLTVIIVLLVAAGSFFGGMKYQQSKQPSRSDFQAMRGARQGGFPSTGPQAGTQMIRGEIISHDDASVTVKLADDSSKIILISANTKINKATEASVDDLMVGEQIMVVGQKNSDESISASQIQLNFGPMGRQ